MKNYKDFPMECIGVSDIATLILAGCRGEDGLFVEQLAFGSDGLYAAYMVEGEDVEIGSHYHLVTTFNYWLKIYDDRNLRYFESANEFRIYRAGDFGVIIQKIN